MKPTFLRVEQDGAAVEHAHESCASESRRRRYRCERAREVTGLTFRQPSQRYSGREWRMKGRYPGRPCGNEAPAPAGRSTDRYHGIHRPGRHDLVRLGGGPARHRSLAPPHGWQAPVPASPVRIGERRAIDSSRSGRSSLPPGVAIAGVARPVGSARRARERPGTSPGWVGPRPPGGGTRSSAAERRPAGGRGARGSRRRSRHRVHRRAARAHPPTALGYSRRFAPTRRRFAAARPAC